MKKLITMVMTIAIMASMFSAQAITQTEKDTQITEYQSQIQACIDYKDNLHQIAEIARSIGLSDVESQMSTLWFAKHAEQGNIESQLEILYATPVSYYAEWQYQQYPVLCQVWQRLREAGFNEYCSAGIIGNMMAECGGQTLNLQPYIYSHGYYGLCMWSLRYSPGVSGRDVQSQMDFLLGNIQYNMNYFGGSNCFNTFCSMQNERTAASYFQKYYERGSGSSIRGTNATKALNYFRNQ